MSVSSFEWIDYLKESGFYEHYDGMCDCYKCRDIRKGFSEWKSKRLLMACLDTGILRTDTYRELYEEVCNFVGIYPK